MLSAIVHVFCILLSVLIHFFVYILLFFVYGYTICSYYLLCMYYMVIIMFSIFSVYDVIVSCLATDNSYLATNKKFK